MPEHTSTAVTRVRDAYGELWVLGPNGWYDPDCPPLAEADERYITSYAELDDAHGPLSPVGGAQ